MDFDQQLAIEKMRIELQNNLEAWKIDRQNEQMLWRANFENSTESFKATIGFANIAIQALLTISGGATISLVAFMGSLFSKGCYFTHSFFFLWFIWASVLACSCAGISYLAQTCFTHEYLKWGRAFQILGIISYIGGLGCFVIGAYVVCNNLQSKEILNCSNSTEINKTMTILFFIVP